MITKYCDLVALKKKWKKSNIDEVKDVIRRVVMNKVLLERQKKALKDKLREREINEKLERENPELAKKLKSEKPKAPPTAKPSSSSDPKPPPS